MYKIVLLLFLTTILSSHSVLKAQITDTSIFKKIINAESIKPEKTNSFLKN